MIHFPIALQLYSVRDDMKADFEGTLKKVKAMGYDGVEFASRCGHSAADIKRWCEEIGLVPVSAHIPFVELIADPEGAILPYKEIGCWQVVIPFLLPEYRPGGERFGEVIEQAKRIGAVCQKLGVTLAYHNHDFEFVKTDGEYAIDRLYREVGPELLQTQLDTCWVKVGGADPAEYVRKYSGRTPTVHLKDFTGQKARNMYALLGVNDGAVKKVDESEKFRYRPCGYGKQDFPAILKASEESGAKWMIVEQDNPSMEKTALECAEMSIQYLRSL